MVEYNQTEQSRVKRGNKKASYDKEVIHAILDNNEICSVAFTIDDTAHVQPINYGRCGDKIYLHGSSKNRMTTTLANAKKACLSVFSLDSMKLTRSAFNHSVNFHSVVIFGSVVDITDKATKLKGLEAIINHFVRQTVGSIAECQTTKNLKQQEC